MALLTHKVSSCTDNYSLFAKEKPFYGIPYLDRSRSSIPSDASSFFSGTRSLRDSTQDLSLIPPRTSKPIGSSGRNATSNKDSPISSKQEYAPDDDATASPHGVATVDHAAQSGVGDAPLADFDQDHDDCHGASNPDTANASFVTAESLNPSPSPPTTTPTTTTTTTSSSSSSSSSSTYSSTPPHPPPTAPASAPPAGESDACQDKPPYIFHRWMKTMFRKSPRHLAPRPYRSASRPGSSSRSLSSVASSSQSGHGTMSSSHRWVTRVMTASTTLASFPLSGHTVSRKSCNANLLDPATIGRMLDRKHALEELISTEEYYIRDLKSLKDVCINRDFFSFP